MGALIDNYSKEKLEQIVNECLSMREVIDKIGYQTHSGSNSRTVKMRLDKYNIDYSHFTHSSPIKRTEENIFIEHSSASQQTLRRWYIKGQYTPYICSICGQKPIWQGKELTLILDHINGINHDDRLENLRWVCPNCNQQLETTGFRGKKYITNNETNNISISKVQPLKNQKYCLECGKAISQNATRCVECSNKLREISLDLMPITREELKDLIRTTPFTTIASQFGVSDNAIRKWCDKFNLPRKKSEINKYTDEDWALI